MNTIKRTALALILAASAAMPALADSMATPSPKPSASPAHAKHMTAAKPSASPGHMMSGHMSSGNMMTHASPSPKPSMNP